MERKKLGLGVSVVALCGALALAGCAAGGANSADVKAPETGGGAAAAEVTVGANGVSHIADWQKVYPLQTASFLNGANNIEERDGDNRSHSHALLAEEMEAFVPDATYAVRCMACHSSWFKEITESHGITVDVLNAPMASFADEFTDMEFWDCRTCHEDDPANTLKPTNIVFNKISKSYNFPEADTVCGQCHYADTQKMYTQLDIDDLYKNGVSPEGMFQTFLEFEEVMDPEIGGNNVMSLDEETGIKMYGEGSVVDLENFQGSNHQNLGMTCASCHMPQTTDPETGETYTSHDASGSPLAKPESLEKCMSCHKGQGIDSTDDMIKMVGEKQLQARKDLRAGKDRLANAYDLIKAAVDGKTVDEATLDQVREEYTYAEAELRIINSDSQGRAVHNPEKVADYIAKANSRIDTIEKTLGAA